MEGPGEDIFQESLCALQIRGVNASQCVIIADGWSLLRECTVKFGYGVLETRKTVMTVSTAITEVDADKLLCPVASRRRSLRVRIM